LDHSRTIGLIFDFHINIISKVTLRSLLLVFKLTLAESLLLVISCRQRWSSSCSNLAQSILTSKKIGRAQQKGQLEIKVKLGPKHCGNANQMSKSDSLIFLFNPKKKGRWQNAGPK